MDNYYYHLANLAYTCSIHYKNIFQTNFTCGFCNFGKKTFFVITWFEPSPISIIYCISPTYANSLANQYESGTMTLHENGGESFVKLVVPPDIINTMLYDDMWESIRTEHELIGYNTMATRCRTMQYGCNGEAIRMHRDAIRRSWELVGTIRNW